MKFLTSLCLALILASMSHAADSIGIYADETGTIRCADLVPYVITDLYIVAHLTSLCEGGIVAAEFKVDNWPETGDDPDLGLIEVIPYSSLYIGYLHHDFAIAWSEPQGAGSCYVTIALLQFLAFGQTWPGQDYWLSIAPGNDCECLVLVDHLYQEHDVYGDSFLLNCVQDCGFCWTAAEPTDWSALKAMY